MQMRRTVLLGLVSVRSASLGAMTLWCSQSFGISVFRASCARDTTTRLVLSHNRNRIEMTTFRQLSAPFGGNLTEKSVKTVMDVEHSRVRSLKH